MMRERIDFLTPILSKFFPKLDLVGLRDIHFYDIMMLLLGQKIDITDDADDEIPLKVLAAGIEPKDDKIVVRLDYSCKSGIKQAYAEIEKDVYSKHLGRRHESILIGYLWAKDIKL